MATVGYSNTPLANKLGIKPSHRILLIDPPSDYASLIGLSLDKLLVTANGSPDLVHLFATDTAAMRSALTRLKPVIRKNPALVIWVSWYKKAAKIPTDLTEDVIRDYALHNDLVDVKVCAVSAVWSGLKLVVPLSKRIESK